jgi:hypothetical protein
VIEGMRGLQARLRAISDTEGLVRELGLETVREAKERVRRKTGTTARTIRLASVSSTEAVVRVRGAGAWLEYGTRPHIIRPRKGKMLRFPAKGVATTLGGRVRSPALRKLGKGAYIFARLVHHPGTRAQPFLIPAAKAAIDKVGIGYIIDRWNRAA